MKIYKIVLLIFFCAFFIMACSSRRASTPQRVFQPDWYGSVGNGEFVYAYGQSTKVNRNAAETAARANAFAEAARYVEAHVQSMMKNYLEEAGVENPQVLALVSEVTRVVSNATFSGTVVGRRETFILDNGRFQSFKRLNIPKSEVNRHLINQIRNEEALYNQFKASQAFDELDRQIRDN